jgi:hypothetical protein
VFWPVLKHSHVSMDESLETTCEIISRRWIQSYLYEEGFEIQLDALNASMLIECLPTRARVSD